MTRDEWVQQNGQHYATCCNAEKMRKEAAAAVRAAKQKHEWTKQYTATTDRRYREWFEAHEAEEVAYY